MKKLLTVASVGLVLILVMSSDVLAQRGRGGGRGGSFGGGGVGGSYGGGMNRSMGSAPSMSHSSYPSMNRAAASPNRYAQPSIQNRGAGAVDPGAAPRTRSMSTSPAAGTSSFRSGGARSAEAYRKPSQQSVGNFLNMPTEATARTGAMSAAGSGAKSGAKPGTFSGESSPPTASQLPASGSGSGTKSFTTQGGATITYGGGTRSGTTSGGAQYGGAAGGIKIETASGETYGKVKAVGGATDGTNSAVRGGSISGASDGQGNSAVNARGGYADSSGYRQGGSVTATKNSAGYTQAWGTAGFGYGNGTGQIASASAVRGPGGNVVSAGYGSSYVNGQFVGGQSWTAVNGNYTHWNAFGPGYATTYPGAWWPGKWAVATTAWATASYAVAGAYCGCPSEGTYYNYGENVTYEDGMVSMDGQPVATAEEYYQEADQIVASGQDPKNEEWMPLGVFALIADGQTQTDKVVQLAVNKEGIIRGNYQDNLADSVTPVTGAVDKETQRVALKLEGKKDLIVETGLYNLTNDEVPILVHFDANRQEPRKLIRLQRPDDAPPAE